MATTKKYTVNPSTDSLALSNASRFETTSKAEANKKAKFWVEQGVKDINYNVDTFVNGVCTKNEFGKYENGKVRVYDIVNYRTPSKKKFVEPKVTKETLSEFFQFDANGKII